MILIVFLIHYFKGFVGVYLAGYILELTGSWSAVFNVTAVINLLGKAKNYIHTKYIVHLHNDCHG